MEHKDDKVKFIPWEQVDYLYMIDFKLDLMYVSDMAITLEYNVYVKPSSAGTVFRRQNLTSIDVRL